MDVQLAPAPSDIAMAAWMTAPSIRPTEAEAAREVDGAFHALGRRRAATRNYHRAEVAECGRGAVRDRAGRHARGAGGSPRSKRCCCALDLAGAGGRRARGRGVRGGALERPRVAGGAPCRRGGPRYLLMGVGRPEDIVRGRDGAGIDLFDCVMPDPSRRANWSPGSTRAGGDEHPPQQPLPGRRFSRRSTPPATVIPAATTLVPTLRHLDRCKRDPGAQRLKQPSTNLAFLPGASLRSAARRPASWPGELAPWARGFHRRPARPPVLWHNAALFAARTAYLNCLESPTPGRRRQPGAPRAASFQFRAADGGVHRACFIFQC